MWCAAGSVDEAAPTTGLFSLPFMVRAAKRQKQAAAGEAAAMLREIEAEELTIASSDDAAADEMLTEEGGGGGGRFTFGSGAVPQVAPPSDDEAPDRYAATSKPSVARTSGV